MATCLTTIGEIDQVTELSSDTTYRISIDQEKNALYTLTNELDQSVFFNIRFIGSYSNFSASLTIYNVNTLRVFGTLNLNQSSVNTSFSIVAGEYYVCIRPIMGEYVLDFKSTFISYNKVTTFLPRSYFGFSSITDLQTSRKPGICNRRLIHTIIEGKLPEGLTMRDNGLITGFLPMMDVDPENDHLPTSSAWYHKISDSEYVTSWGRAYRFKVHLTLFDDDTKEDTEWFYISILNDFSKNFALVDKYEILEDDSIATFEEKIKLNTLTLCPPNPCDTSEVVLDSPIDDPLKDMSPSNRLYMDVENHQVDDPDEIVLYEFDTGFDEGDDEYIEMFPIDKIYIQNNQFSYMGNNLFDYYTKYFNSEEDLIIQLKDSYMFNRYLKENNFSPEYINDDVLDRFEYEIINFSLMELDNIYYIQFKNKIDITYNEDTDAQERIDQIQAELYNQLPWSPYALYGFSSTFNLIQVK